MYILPSYFYADSQTAELLIAVTYTSLKDKQVLHTNEVHLRFI